MESVDERYWRERAQKTCEAFCDAAMRIGREEIDLAVLITLGNKLSRENNRYYEAWKERVENEERVEKLLSLP